MKAEPGNSRGWTFDTMEKWIEDENAARNKAVEAALTEAKAHLVDHNGLTGALKDAQAKFVTRKELWLAVIAIIGAVGTIAQLPGVR